jgi:hypothetical protein
LTEQIDVSDVIEKALGTNNNASHPIDERNKSEGKELSKYRFNVTEDPSLNLYFKNSILVLYFSLRQFNVSEGVKSYMRNA